MNVLTPTLVGIILFIKDILCDILCCPPLLLRLIGLPYGVAVCLTH